MKHLALIVATSLLFALPLQAQGTTGGLSAVAALRSTEGEVHGYDYEFDDATFQSESDTSLAGTWNGATDADFQDYYGVPVGRGLAVQDSTITSDRLLFDLDTTASTAGNLFSEDSRAKSVFEVTFTTTTVTRFSLNAQAALTLGYNEANVELYPASAPNQEIAELHLLGGLGSGTGAISESGWLPAGTYVLRVDCEAFAGLGSMGNADSQNANVLGGLVLYHACDFDHDGDVDLDDRQAFLQEWAQGDDELTDMDGDGDSDRFDAIGFILRWRRALRP